MTTPIYLDTVRTLNSSVLRAVGYDSTFDRLYLQFHNGTVVKYGPGNEHHYRYLISAKSAGAYYNAWIRGRIRSEETWENARLASTTINTVNSPASKPVKATDPALKEYNVTVTVTVPVKAESIVAAAAAVEKLFKDQTHLEITKFEMV